ncbi:MAG: metal-dependent transcriptional regulator [Firmicutes bacterium]|nr:metal-dependent transcriptional regulator [Bacillota bacterium]
MILAESGEDYLEAMLMMQEKHGFIRSIDVAEQLHVTKPSVSYATKRLREAGYITMDSDSLITLTDAGMEVANRIYTRHKMLTDFFVRLGVDPQTAREDACKVEHDLSEQTFNAIREAAEKGFGTDAKK